ncbi:possible secreted protein (plasmid) [Rhodococcus jostii RHA1]|uniref:Possible secreted protein n=1 Tax=Rhodococcus jostii (strain RHA1) TaxID=101510 RepID=Q0RX01_RHOJR|nr:DUF4185 domain-containing protein [Rhodococcus jostii]ABH00185.1 possible secreted protein [Rhodococcus jostii RHA1]
MKIRDLTPVPQFGVGGTDLGIPVRMPTGEIGFFFGDTFAENRVGGPGWRSPVLLYSHTHDLDDGVRFHRAAGGSTAKQLWDYPHNNPEFSTVLPTDAIVIGTRIYLHVLVVRGLPDTRWTEIQYSDDNGETWTHGGPKARWEGWEFGGHRRMLTWEHGGDGFVYVMTTGGLERDKNVLLFRCPEDQLLNRDFYEPWGFSNGAWAWGNPPTPILPVGSKVGELCLRRMQNNWVLSYFNEAEYNITIRVVGQITDNWHTAPTFRPVRGPSGNGGPDVVTRLYGGYVHPDSTFDNFHIIVSEWAESGWPYRAMQFRAQVQPAVPIEEDEHMSAREVAAAFRDDHPVTLYDGSGRKLDLREAIAEILWKEVTNLGLEGRPVPADRQDDQFGHILSTHALAEQNNKLLRALCEKAGIDVDQVLG